MKNNDSNNKSHNIYFILNRKANAVKIGITRQQPHMLKRGDLFRNK